MILRNFPLGSDLVVDVGSFFQCISASDMSITRHSEPLLPLSVDDLDTGVQPEAVELPDNLSQFSRFESCIECGICMSACPTVAADEKFLAPSTTHPVMTGSLTSFSVRPWPLSISSFSRSVKRTAGAPSIIA